MTPTDKPMTVDALMKLATDYAHCYAFVGDDTMPRRQAELRAAIEQYGREQSFESTAQRDVREACCELRDALGNPVISGTGDQTLQGQTIRMAAAQLREAAGRGSGEPVAFVNRDELDNMRDDRTATIAGVKDGWRKTPLYAAPQSREPLTDEQALELATQEFPYWREDIQTAFVLQLTRAIERAHNIRSEG